MAPNETSRPATRAMPSAIQSTGEEWPLVAISTTAARTANPIRKLVDQLMVKPAPGKEFITLALGDPTVFGNLNTDNKVIEAVVEQARTFKSNGYPPAVGYEHSRAAIASRYSTADNAYVTEDVVIASGCSGALELAISVLVSEGQAILLPIPGFSIYRTICESRGIIVVDYPLLPDTDWEINLSAVETLIRSHNENPTGEKPVIAAWLINNPSNPCGSVYSKSHLEACLTLAKTRKIPVIADEIYEDMVFSEAKFWPMASLKPKVPILTCGGIAKRYLVPGWRLGWILIHDPFQSFKEVRKGLFNLAGILLGANSIIQAALPLIFENTPKSFYEATNKYLENNATIVEKALSRVPCLQVITPQGAMYMLVGLRVSEFHDISDDVQFSEMLVSEEAVLCLPGRIFGMPNFFRIVLSGPTEKMIEAVGRIQRFCERHMAHVEA